MGTIGPHTTFSTDLKKCTNHRDTETQRHRDTEGKQDQDGYSAGQVSHQHQLDEEAGHENCCYSGTKGGRRSEASPGYLMPNAYINARLCPQI